jgi:hypothetical protein
MLALLLEGKVFLDCHEEVFKCVDLMGKKISDRRKGTIMENKCFVEFMDLLLVTTPKTELIDFWISPNAPYQNNDFMGMDIGILTINKEFNNKRMFLIQVKNQLYKNEVKLLREKYINFLGAEVYYAFYGKKKRLKYDLETPSFQFIRINA